MDLESQASGLKPDEIGSSPSVYVHFMEEMKVSPTLGSDLVHWLRSCAKETVSVNFSQIDGSWVIDYDFRSLIGYALYDLRNRLLSGQDASTRLKALIERLVDKDMAVRRTKKRREFLNELIKRGIDSGLSEQSAKLKAEKDFEKLLPDYLREGCSNFRINSSSDLSDEILVAFISYVVSYEKSVNYKEVGLPAEAEYVVSRATGEVDTCVHAGANKGVLGYRDDSLVFPVQLRLLYDRICEFVMKTFGRVKGGVYRVQLYGSNAMLFDGFHIGNLHGAFTMDELKYTSNDDFSKRKKGLLVRMFSPRREPRGEESLSSFVRLCNSIFSIVMSSVKAKKKVGILPFGCKLVISDVFEYVRGMIGSNPLDQISQGLGVSQSKLVGMPLSEVQEIRMKMENYISTNYGNSLCGVMYGFLQIVDEVALGGVSLAVGEYGRRFAFDDGTAGTPVLGVGDPVNAKNMLFLLIFNMLFVYPCASGVSYGRTGAADIEWLSCRLGSLAISESYKDGALFIEFRYKDRGSREVKVAEYRGIKSFPFDFHF